MNNEQVAHKWVYNSGAGSQAQGSNFSYSMSRLYSYGSIMAVIDREKKLIEIDRRISNYSHSSKKHASHMHRAIPSYYKVFEYDFNEGAFVYYFNSIMLLVGKQLKARKWDYTQQILKLIQEAKDFAELKHVKKDIHLKQILEIDTEKLQESYNKVKDKIEKQIVAKKKKNDALNQLSRQNNLDRFLIQTYNPKDKSTVKFDPNYKGVYLKADDELGCLCTTNGIIVILTNALLLYKNYLNDFKSIIGKKLEHYVVVKSSETEVTIGCTTISAKELKRVLSKYMEK
jgi:hypothetical protein